MIPKELSIMGCTVTVEILSDEEWQHEGAVGLYDPSRLSIKLLKTSQQLMEHTYFHELVHCILHTIGRTKLSDDEELVDMVAGLFHQAMKTAVYPNIKKGK